MFNGNDISNFLDSLFSNQHEGYFEIRLINENKAKSKFFSFPLKINKVLNYVKEYIGTYHIYYGVNPRIKKKGTKESVTESICLWADLDSKDYTNGKKEAHNRLQNIDVEPSIIIDSGHGYHAYWLLEGGISTTKAEKLNRQLAYILGADSVPDVSHILRLPGTPNIKDPEDTSKTTSDKDQWELAEIDKSTGRNIDVSVLEEFLPDVNILDIARDVETNFEAESDIDTLKDLSDKLSNNDVLNRAEKLPSHLKNDRSKNDFWVACQLYKDGFSDADVYKCFELFKKYNWAAGKKFKKRGKKYLLDCTLPTAKQEADKFDIYVNKIKETNGTRRADYIEKAIKSIKTDSEIKRETKLQAIKEAADGDIGITQLRKQANALSKFNARKMAENILQDYDFLYTGGEFRVYNNGVYRQNGKVKLHRILQKRLGTNWTTTKRNEVREWIRDHTKVPENDIGHPGHLINVKNGMYDIYKDKLLDHDPSYKSLTQIHVAYNPDAECPRLEQFIDEVFPEENQDLIWEHAGYPLLRDLHLKKFLVLLGRGNNGKSVWLNLIHKCLGNENVAHEGLSDLSNNRYSIRELFGRIANIHADIESLPLKRTGILKQLTGGDPVRAEVKYGDVFTFKNKAKLFFAVNELPHVKDYNDAFFERIHIVKCPNRFEGDNAEINLLDTLTTEEAKSVWLNKAIEGAKRLLNSQQFTKTKSVNKEIRKFKHQSDSVTEFVDHNLISGENKFEKCRDVYNTYQQWCNAEGRKATSMSTFVKRSGLKTSKQKINRKRVKCFMGIRLNDISQSRFASGNENVSIKQ